MILNENLKIISGDIERVKKLHKITPFSLLMKKCENYFETLKEHSDEKSDVFEEYTPDLPDKIYQNHINQSAEELYAQGMRAYIGYVWKSELKGIDHESALMCFVMAASKHHPKTAVKAGEMFSDGEGTETNYAEAFYWITAAANWGDEEGYLILGDFYMKGYGVVEQDHKIAAYFFKISADLGYPIAQYNYASMSLSGNDIPQNTDAGLKYLKDAAERGIKPAVGLADKLGLEYSIRHGTINAYIRFLKNEVEFRGTPDYKSFLDAILPKLNEVRRFDHFTEVIKDRCRDFHSAYMSCYDVKLRECFFNHYLISKRLVDALDIYSDYHDPIRYIKDNLTDDLRTNAFLLREIYRIKSYEINKLDKERFELITLWVRRGEQAAALKDFGLVLSEEFDSKRYIFDDEYTGLDFYEDIEKYITNFKNISNGTADVETIMNIAEMLFKRRLSMPAHAFTSQYYEMAAEKGSVKAMYSAALCYAYGVGGTYIEPDKAMYWLRKAAAEGNKYSMEIVEQYDKCNDSNAFKSLPIYDVEEDSKWYKHKETVENYYEKADAGDMQYQYELAKQLVPGKEFGAFKRSAPKAAYYYELAAKQGCVEAAFELAALYETGSINFDKDLDKAFYWRKICADAGNAEACYMLGEMYLDGIGTEMNEKIGEEYIKKARKLGKWSFKKNIGKYFKK